MYTPDESAKKVCRQDADCRALDNSDGSSKGACISHMWKYAGNHEAAKGCWDLSLCNNEYGT